MCTISGSLRRSSVYMRPTSQMKQPCLTGSSDIPPRISRDAGESGRGTGRPSDGRIRQPKPPARYAWIQLCPQAFLVLWPGAVCEHGLYRGPVERGGQENEESSLAATEPVVVRVIVNTHVTRITSRCVPMVSPKHPGACERSFAPERARGSDRPWWVSR